MTKRNSGRLELPERNETGLFGGYRSTQSQPVQPQKLACLSGASHVTRIQIRENGRISGTAFYSDNQIDDTSVLQRMGIACVRGVSGGRFEGFETQTSAKVSYGACSGSPRNRMEVQRPVGQASTGAVGSMTTVSVDGESAWEDGVCQDQNPRYLADPRTLDSGATGPPSGAPLPAQADGTSRKSLLTKEAKVTKFSCIPDLACSTQQDIELELFLPGDARTCADFPYNRAVLESRESCCVSPGLLPKLVRDQESSGEPEPKNSEVEDWGQPGFTVPEHGEKVVFYPLCRLGQSDIGGTHVSEPRTCVLPALADDGIVFDHVDSVHVKKPKPNCKYSPSFLLDVSTAFFQHVEPDSPVLPGHLVISGLPDASVDAIAEDGHQVSFEELLAQLEDEAGGCRIFWEQSHEVRADASKSLHVVENSKRAIFHLFARELHHMKVAEGAERVQLRKFLQNRDTEQLVRARIERDSGVAYGKILNLFAGSKGQIQESKGRVLPSPVTFSRTVSTKVSGLAENEHNLRVGIEKQQRKIFEILGLDETIEKIRIIEFSKLPKTKLLRGAGNVKKCVIGMGIVGTLLLLFASFLISIPAIYVAYTYKTLIVFLVRIVWWACWLVFSIDQWLAYPKLFIFVILVFCARTRNHPYFSDISTHALTATVLFTTTLRKWVDNFYYNAQDVLYQFLHMFLTFWTKFCINVFVNGGVFSGPFSPYFPQLRRVIRGQHNWGDSRKIVVQDRSAGNRCLWWSAELLHRDDPEFLVRLRAKTGSSTYLDYLEVCRESNRTPYKCTCLAYAPESEKPDSNPWFIPGRPLLDGILKDQGMGHRLADMEAGFIFVVDDEFVKVFGGGAMEVDWIEMTSRVYHFIAFDSSTIGKDDQILDCKKSVNPWAILVDTASTNLENEETFWHLGHQARAAIFLRHQQPARLPEADPTSTQPRSIEFPAVISTGSQDTVEQMREYSLTDFICDARPARVGFPALVPSVEDAVGPGNAQPATGLSSLQDQGVLSSGNSCSVLLSSTTSSTQLLQSVQGTVVQLPPCMREVPRPMPIQGAAQPADQTVAYAFARPAYRPGDSMPNDLQDVFAVPRAMGAHVPSIHNGGCVMPLEWYAPTLVCGSDGLPIPPAAPIEIANPYGGGGGNGPVQVAAGAQYGLYAEIFNYADGLFRQNATAMPKATETQRQAVLVKYTGYLREAWMVLKPTGYDKATADPSYVDLVVKRQRQIVHLTVEEMRTRRELRTERIYFGFARLRMPKKESDFFATSMHYSSFTMDLVFWTALCPTLVLCVECFVVWVLFRFFFLEWTVEFCHRRNLGHPNGDAAVGAAEAAANAMSGEFKRIANGFHRVQSQLKRVDDFLNNVFNQNYDLRGSGNVNQRFADPKRCADGMGAKYVSASSCVHGFKKRCPYCVEVQCKTCGVCGGKMLDSCSRCANEDVNVVNYEGEIELTTTPVLMRTASPEYFRRVCTAVQVMSKCVMTSIRKPGAFLYGPMVVTAPVVEHCDSLSLLNSVINRQFSLNPVDPTARSEFRKFIREAIPNAQCFRKPILAMQEWIAGLNPRQRAKMSVLAPKFQESCVELKQGLVRKQSGKMYLFQKNEMLGKRATPRNSKGPEVRLNGEWDYTATPNAPRAINFPGDLVNYYAAREVATAYNEIKQHWSINKPGKENEFVVSIASGHNAAEVGSWMTQNDRLFGAGNYDLVETDASRFDGHSHTFFFEEFVQRMREVYAVRRCFNTSLRAQNEVVSSSTTGLKVKLRGTMKSGVPHTTLLNSIINAFVLYLAFLFSGIWGRGAVAGDDGIIAVSKGKGKEYCEAIAKAAKFCGHEYKAKVVTLNTAKFLSSYFTEVFEMECPNGIVTDYVLTPEPCRFLTKFGFSLQKQKCPKQWLAQNCLAATKVFQAVPQIARCFSIGAGKGKEEWLMEDHEQWMNPCRPVPQHRQVDEVLRYGVALSEFVFCDFSRHRVFKERFLVDAFAHVGLY